MTQLASGLPRPRSPFANVHWLDDGTRLLVMEGGAAVNNELDIADSDEGMIVLDVPSKRVIAAWQGINPYATARPGHSGELLIVDGNYLEHTGWNDRIGRIDPATGCAALSPWLGAASVVIEPQHDSFVVAPDGPTYATDGHRKLERWDAATLSKVAEVSTDRFDAIAYDEKTDLLVMSSYGDAPIVVRDPVTLKPRGSLRLPVAALEGFSHAPGQITMHYQTRCTVIGSRFAMALRCREPQSFGEIVVGLDPLAVVARHPGVERPAHVSPNDSATSANGMVAIPTKHETIEIRDASGTLVWAFALPHR